MQMIQLFIQVITPFGKTGSHFYEMQHEIPLHVAAGVIKRVQQAQMKQLAVLFIYFFQIPQEQLGNPLP